MAKKISKEESEVVKVEVTATAFADMAGCTKANVTQWITDGKLTEGTAWRKVGNNKMIHVENAKAELKSRLKPRQVKNKNLIAFLGIEESEVAAMVSTGKTDDVALLNQSQVRDAAEKEQLRILIIERMAMEGKYIERELVDKNMEAAGLAIKSVFKNLVPRSTKDIRDAPSEREAQNVFYKHIEDCLLQVEQEIAKDISRQ